MSLVVGVLATLDTKGDEARYLHKRIEAEGGRALLIDLGVVGEPTTAADIPRAAVAEAGGTPLTTLLVDPTRETAGPVMVAGATRIVQQRLADDGLHALIGMGGTQGTSTCTAVMRALPYGIPKLMVSTVASGDTSSFVDVKDITMMFSVGDLLGLNPFTRRVLANAAAAACGMARVDVASDTGASDRPTIGMTNLGTLTEGAMRAVQRFGEKGYEVIVFHAVGSGGRAMEQMMKDGLIGAVFDYALGEITDELFDGLRASGPERLTVAGKLGLPQVICPGGAEHVGILVDPPNSVPPAYRDHAHVFHSPEIFVPRLNADESRRVAREIGRRLEHTRGRAVLMLPRGGTSRYTTVTGPLHDAAADEAMFAELRACLPDSVEIVERDAAAEDPAFVDEAVDRLIAMIESDESDVGDVGGESGDSGDSVGEGGLAGQARA